MTQRSIALAGRLGIGELGALIDGARLLLANNIGPAHIAAAMGTPVVVLYALKNPQVSSDDVVDAAMALLREVEPRAAEQGRARRADIHMMQGATA